MVVAALENTLAVVVLEGRVDAAVGLSLVLLEMRLLGLVLPALDVNTLVEFEVVELDFLRWLSVYLKSWKWLMWVWL